MSELKAAWLTDRGLVRISGPDARSFLQGIITNNVDLVTADRAVYSGLLTPQGKFLFDFFIAADPADDMALILDCDGARQADLVKRLGFYKLRAKVNFDDLTGTHSLVAFWGGQAPQVPAGEGILFADPRFAGLGSRLMTTAPEKAMTDTGATPMMEADYHRHRIALGIGDASLDFEPDRSFPLEMNFDDLNGIDFKKGCFIGQEVTSRTKRRGNVRKRLLPCLVEGPMPAHGAPIRAGAREVGTVFSTDAEDNRVIALLRLDLIHDAILEVGEASLTVEKPAWASFVLEGIADDDEG